MGGRDYPVDVVPDVPTERERRAWKLGYLAGLEQGKWVRDDLLSRLGRAQVLVLGLLRDLQGTDVTGDLDRERLPDWADDVLVETERLEKSWMLASLLTAIDPSVQMTGGSKGI